MNYARFKNLTAHFFAVDEGGNLRERYAEAVPAKLPPLVLAYIGDAYYHLFIRRRLLFFDQTNIRLIHDFAAQLVSAVWQAKAFHHLADSLTEREREIFRRGRNAKSHVPKSAGANDYHASTGLEALMGTLYLENNLSRLQELAEAAFQFTAREIGKAEPTNTNL